MHKYWSRKPSEIIAEYIESYTKPGDIILDAFSGSGVTIIEAVKLGRKAIGIDLNPVANFITRVTLEPVNLSQLVWAFRDVEAFCEETISDLFYTRCQSCGELGIMDFVVRHMDEPRKIGYSCSCSRQRLFKLPDEFDKQKEAQIEQMEIPFWYPDNTLLPSTRKEKFKYIHELFTKRNLIALSSILHAIENISSERVRNVMKLAFSASLANSSRLKPLSKQNNGRPTLQEGWIAVRFYTPPDWQEVNPLQAFKRSFKRVYAGKKESNEKLRNIEIASNFEELQEGKANVILLHGSSNELINNKIPDESVDYILTDPPFGDAIQYLDLSTFWGAWLGFRFDYEHEIVINTREKTRKLYEENMQSVFREMSRVLKGGGYAHIFYSDAKGPHLHMLLKSLMYAGISPEKILNQPQPGSFGNAVRPRKSINITSPRKTGGYSGSYIIRGQASGSSRVPMKMPIFETDLRRKISEAARQTIDIQNGETAIGAVLHSVYDQLDENDIAIYAQYDAEKFVKDSVSEFAQLTGNGRLIYTDQENLGLNRETKYRRLRKAILDAESLIADEKDRINRVRQLTEKRLNLVGITPENIQHLEGKISQQEIKKNRLKIFTSLYTYFGRELGFLVKHSMSPKILVVWTKEDSLNIHFEISQLDTRVSSSLPQDNNDAVCQWGTIPHSKLELRLKQWCEDNQGRGAKIKNILKGLEGPSYDSRKNQQEKPQAYRHLRLKVQYNKEWCREHYLMKLKAPKNVTLDIKPGQFLHIVCDPEEEKGSEAYPLTLRRPFSIHGTQHKGFIRGLLSRSGEIPIEIREILNREISSIDILYKVVGEGTTILSEKVNKGSIVDAIGPCGNGFTIGKEQYSIIVAGGIGIAPLVALAEQLRYLDKKVYVYFGTLNRELLKLALTRRSDSTPDFGFLNGVTEITDKVQVDFKEVGVDEVKICTYDDVLGEEKLVTELLEQDLKSKRFTKHNARIYTCGPKGMLQSVADIAADYSIECEVLLEERMACGIGTCLSCTCEVISMDGGTTRKRVCVDGPVFSSSEIKW